MLGLAGKDTPSTAVWDLRDTRRGKFRDTVAFAYGTSLGWEDGLPGMV